MGVFLTLCLEFLFSITPFGIFFQVVYHGVTDCIGERGFFPPQDLMGQVINVFKRKAPEVLALVLLVQRHLWI